MKLKLSIDHDRNTPKEIYKAVQRNLRVQAKKIEQNYTREEIDEIVLGWQIP